MRRWLLALCVVFTMLLPVTLAAAPDDSPTVEAKARAWMNALQTGSWNRRELTAKANALLTPALTRSFEKSYSVMGRPLSFTLTDVLTVPSGTEYNFLVTLQHAQVNELFILDRDGKLAFLFTPSATPRLGENQLIAALSSRLQRETQADSFAGAVLVARDGHPIFAHAYGLADRVRGVPNTLQTRFRIGSMNKMFTAVAVLQLVQAGKLRLNEPFGTYVKDYPNKDVSSHVTVAELLTHTGGTGDFFGPIFDEHRLELKTLDDYEKFYGKRGIVSPIGTYAYSNYGYILLGLVIERVTHKSYYEYVKKHIYDVAEMTSSGSLPENMVVPNRSVGYTRKDGRWVSNSSTLPYRGIPAGGGYSTVSDLLKFGNALQSHKLLNAYYTSLLVAPKVARRGIGYYAYGIADDYFNGMFCFGHNGGAPGMSGELDICTKSGYAVAVLSNLDPPAAQSMARFIVERVPAE